MKVVFITTMTPSGHYSQYITSGLYQQKDIELIVYANKKEGGLRLKQNGKIKFVWSKSIKYIFEIVRELKKDRPDIVHIQQEFNMYGGTITALLFPILILLIRVMGLKVVVTIHAAVYKKQVDKEFMHLFHKNSNLIKPIFLRVFFDYIYRCSSFFSNAIVIHTNLKKNIMISDYGVSKSKINIISIVIPKRSIDNKNKKDYFFYFGYMVRRKGLEYALEGFKKYLSSHPKSKTSLILAGGVIKGQEKAFEEIKQFIKDFDLEEKVIIKGFLEERQLDDLYKKAYAVIIPAKVSMGSSGPFFHAVSYAKCVLASKEGYFIEDIKHLNTGILVENNKWSSAFEFAVKNPGTIRKIEHNVELKANLQRPYKIAQQYIKLYKSL